MRKDMHKVLTERPRVGGWGKSKGKSKKDKFERHYDRSNDEDDSPKRLSIRKVHKACGNDKSFADLIGPLYRFLNSRIGRKWDVVYGEITKGLNSRSTVHKHLLDHVGWAVSTKNYVGADGRLWAAPKGRPPYILADTPDGRMFVHGSTYRFDQFFVDLDGVLRKIRFVKVRREPEEKRFVRTGDAAAYVRGKNGAWFFVEFTKVPGTSIVRSILDMRWDESPFDWSRPLLSSEKFTMRSKGYSISSWKSASSKEIKKFKLNEKE